MSPRCRYKGNTKSDFHSATSLFFLLLQHENYLHHHRNRFIGTGHTGHIPAFAAHHPFSATDGCALFQRLSPSLSMVAESEAPRPLYPELSRKQSHPFASQNRLITPHVGHHALLHFLSDSAGLGQDHPVSDSCRSHLSYTLFQDIEEVRQSVSCIGEFIFPMLHRVLTDHIGHIFHGDERDLF